jgi:3-methyladenine DNA glycosylase AlkD
MGEMTYAEVVAELERLGDPESANEMARFGITPERTWGVRMPELRALGKRIGTDHELAARLWSRDVRETRILASLVDDPEVVSGEQMDEWVDEFDYWEICDQCCMNLFWRTPLAYDKCHEWTGAGGEYVRRAGFALMAVLAWKDKGAERASVLAFLDPIERGAADERHTVAKSVSWALRQIGKRDIECNAAAIEVAGRLADAEEGAARRVGREALKELTSERVQERLAVRRIP